MSAENRERAVPQRQVWDAHAWLSCGCGGDYTLDLPPVIGDELWCYWHERRAQVRQATAQSRIIAVSGPQLGASS